MLYLPAQALTPAIQFATTILWTHLLDPVAFGVVAFVIAGQEAVAWAAITWWSMFVLRFRQRHAAEGDVRLRQMDSRVAFVSVAVMMALTAPMLALIGQALNTPLLLAAASYFILRTLLAHYSEWARADHQIAAYSAAQLVASFVGSALSVAVILVEGPSPALVIAAQTVAQALALALLFRQAGLRFGLGRFDRAIFDEALRYCSPLVISGLTGWIAPNCIRVLVQHWDGVVGLGLLSVGWGLGQRIAGVLSMLFTAAAYPLAVSNLESGDRRGALAQVSLNGVFLLALLAPAVAGAAMLSEPLVTLLIAEQFRATTIVVLPIALLAAAIRAVRAHVSDQTTLLLQKTGFTMWICIGEALANIILCALGLHFGGVVGATIGVVIGTSLSTVASFAYTFALGLPSPSTFTLARIVVATGIMCAALTLLPAPVGAVAVTATILFGAAVYALVIALTFPECRSVVGRRLKRA